MAERIALGTAPEASAPATTPTLDALWTRPIDVRSVALYGILGILVFHTLRVAESLLLPIVLAVLASFALSPIVRALARVHLPRWAAAALVILLSLGALVGTAALVAAPAAEWIERAPGALRQVERRLAPVRQPIEEMALATEQVERMTQVAPEAGGVEVRPRESLLELLFSGTRDFLASAVIVLVLLYFLLASGESFAAKVVSTIPRFRDKRRAAELLSEVERDVSRYLLVVLTINVLLGVVVAAAMFLLEMPNALLWGVVATVTNFVPFLGAMVGTAVVGLAALLTFEEVGRALLVPLAYASITGVEGLLVTPSVLGRRLTLSPVLVFVSVLAWSWLWGVPGALVAVPVLAVGKMVIDRIETLQPLGRLMGTR